MIDGLKYRQNYEDSHIYYRALLSVKAQAGFHDLADAAHALGYRVNSLLLGIAVVFFA